MHAKGLRLCTGTRHCGSTTQAPAQRRGAEGWTGAGLGPGGFPREMRLQRENPAGGQGHRLWDQRDQTLAGPLRLGAGDSASLTLTSLIVREDDSTYRPGPDRCEE